jgi:hypothetical protein
MGLTVDELRRLREILRESQASGDPSPIPVQLAAALPKAAGVWDRMQSPSTMAVIAWLGMIIAVISFLIELRSPQPPTTPTPTPTPAQIEQIVEQVVRDIDQPPQAPPGPAQPPTAPTS